MELNQFIEDYIRENFAHISVEQRATIDKSIRAGYYFSKGIVKDGDDGISKVDYDNLPLLNKILAKANLVFNSSELDWSKKYDIIFNDKISVRVYDLFEWLDLDTSYEEDVTAFMNAFNNYVEERNKLSKYE